jgi:putative hydrolase of the HAD superfamily
MTASSRPSVASGAAVPGLDRLHRADAWVFDLDNTLYPASVDLFAQIDLRMRGYIAAYLGLELQEARALQKRYFHEYGTSLRGLMDMHGMDPRPFLEHVHDIDLSGLEPSPTLERALARLPGRKVVFTNASSWHAERVMARLGIGHHFEAVFDIMTADFRPKPEPGTYRALVSRLGLAPTRSVMLEDLARNLVPAAALGMMTVWVRSAADAGPAGVDEGLIDYVVDDLVVWLEQVADRLV